MSEKPLSNQLENMISKLVQNTLSK
jgi:hypothetical protein